MSKDQGFRQRSKTLPSKQHSCNGHSLQNGQSSPGHVVDTNSIARSLKHSTSVDLATSVSLDLKNESKVLVLYTGGTIGMVRNHAGVLVPEANAMEANIRRIVTMHDEQYSQMRFGGGGAGGVAPGDLLPLVLPGVLGHKRVIYTICEYDPLLDSSNMTMDDWIQIAKDIRESYHSFDGFVILHGTDTLAYTSSALSFMLENLGKPVIVTGSPPSRPGATGETTWWGPSSWRATTASPRSLSTSTTSCSGATELSR